MCVHNKRWWKLWSDKIRFSKVLGRSSFSKVYLGNFRMMSMQMIQQGCWPTPPVVSIAPTLINMENEIMLIMPRSSKRDQTSWGNYVIFFSRGWKNLLASFTTPLPYALIPNKESKHFRPGFGRNRSTFKWTRYSASTPRQWRLSPRRSGTTFRSRRPCSCHLFSKTRTGNISSGAWRGQNLTSFLWPWSYHLELWVCHMGCA